MSNLKYNFQKFLILFFIIFTLFSGFTHSTFAESESLTGDLNGGYIEDYNYAGDPESSSSGAGANTPTSSQKDNVIRIREPFPNQSNEIIVSTDKGSLNILADYVSSIFRFVAALSIIISVLVLMAAGFKIMVAGGDTSARDDAKEWMQKVLMGLAFLFLSGLFLKTINPSFYVFGGGNNSSSGGSTATQQVTPDLNGGYSPTEEDDRNSGYYGED